MPIQKDYQFFTKAKGLSNLNQRNYSFLQTLWYWNKFKYKYVNYLFPKTSCLRIFIFLIPKRRKINRIKPTQNMTNKKNVISLKNNLFSNIRPQALQHVLRI